MLFPLPVKIFLEEKTGHLIVIDNPDLSSTTSYLQLVQELIQLIANIQKAAICKYSLYNCSSFFKEYLKQKKLRISYFNTPSLSSYDIALTTTKTLSSKKKGTTSQETSPSCFQKKPLSSLELLIRYIQETLHSYTDQQQIPSKPLSEHTFTHIFELLSHLEHRISSLPTSSVVISVEKILPEASKETDVKKIEPAIPLKKKFLLRWQQNSQSSTEDAQATTSSEIDFTELTSTKKPKIIISPPGSPIVLVKKTPTPPMIITSSILTSSPITLTNSPEEKPPLASPQDHEGGSDDEDVFLDSSIPEVDVSLIISRKPLEKKEPAIILPLPSLEPSSSKVSSLPEQDKQTTSFLYPVDKKEGSKSKKRKISESSDSEKTDRKRSRVNPTTFLDSSSSTTLSLLNQYFVSISIKNQTVFIHPRTTISRPLDMKTFLKQIQEAKQFSSYVCCRKIPEIPIQESGNKLDFIKAMYSIVLRNQYFFYLGKAKSQTITVAPKIGASRSFISENELTNIIHNLLNELNQTYYDALNISDEAVESKHHTDLQALHINPLAPPKNIMSDPPLVLLTIRSRNSSPALWITKIAFTFNKRSQFWNILRNAQLFLKEVKKASLKKDFYIACNDGSFPLFHPQKTVLSPQKAIKIFKDICERNKKLYQDYVALLEKNYLFTTIRTTLSYRNTLIAIQDTENEIALWEQNIGVDVVPLTSTVDTDSFSEILSDNDQEESIAKLPLFLSIEPNISFTGFTITRRKRKHSHKNLLDLLSHAQKLINSKVYNCRISIPGIHPPTSQQPLTILKMLFTVICITTASYIESLTNITPLLIQEILKTLKILNEAYSNADTNSFDPSTTDYHPHLQTIIEKYNLLTLQDTQVTLPYSYKCPVISITYFPPGFYTHTNTINQSSVWYFLYNLHQQLIHNCIHVLGLIQDSSLMMLTSFSASDQDTSSTNIISRFQALKKCKSMLTQIKNDLLSNDLFVSMRSRNHYKDILERISITSYWLDAHLNNEPLPHICSLPFNLITVPLHLLTVRLNHKIYVVNNTMILCSQRKETVTHIQTHISFTNKWLKQSLKLKTGEKIFYQNKRLDSIFSLIPALCAALQQNLLQITKVLKISKNKKADDEIIQSLENSINILKEGYTFLKKQWTSSNYEVMPTLDSMLEFHSLLLAPAQEEALKNDISYIDSLPCLQETNLSDQEASTSDDSLSGIDE